MLKRFNLLGRGYCIETLISNDEIFEFKLYKCNGEAAGITITILRYSIELTVFNEVYPKDWL